MSNSTRRNNSFDRALAVLVDEHKDDSLLQALVMARNMAANNPESRLLRHIDDICWKRVGEIQEGR